MAHAHPVAVVIEDEPQIRRFVRGALEAEGWQVHEAETLRTGLTEAGTRKPDLLVLDLGLPDGDGLDLIRDVRGWSRCPSSCCRRAATSRQDRRPGCRRR
jgi:two-component system KDP operon response regulator KdpE